MSTLAALAGRYAKFLTSAGGLAVLYLEQYGPVWHYRPALLGLAAALGVLGVPNKRPDPAAPGPAS